MNASSDRIPTWFICHPFASDPAINAKRVTDIARKCSHVRVIPLAPQIYLPQFIDEATERDLALNLCLALVALSDEVRVYGEPSEGMLLEIAEARRLGIAVIDGPTGEAWPTKREPPR